MKQYGILLLALFVLVLSGCNDNPAWLGKANATNKAEIQAGETCKCIYEMLEKESTIDRDALIGEIKAQMKVQKTTSPPSLYNSTDPEITKALAMEEAFSMKMDDCDCMKPVHENLLNQGITFEEMMEKLDLHCILTAFYN